MLKWMCTFVAANYTHLRKAQNTTQSQEATQEPKKGAKINREGQSPNKGGPN
jgi:hypothetical protein